jgi:hypothetical protein
MKRILLLVTVALVMAVMMLALAMPAFADTPWTGFGGACTAKNGKPGNLFIREGTNKEKPICLVNPDQF